MSVGEQRWALPRGPEPRLDACGLAWDAVRVSTVLGVCVLGLVREHSGAVIEDVAAERWYWLVRPGAAGAWRLPGVRVLGRGSYLLVPPPGERTWARVRWQVSADSAGWLTDAGRLHDAVHKVHATVPTAQRGLRPDR